MDDLARLIEAAFSRAPYPGDEDIVSPVIVGGATLRDPEREEVADALRGKNWRHLDKAESARVKQSLASLSPAGFRYFLPAIMLAVLRDSTLDASSLVYGLTLPEEAEGGEVRRWMHQRFSALTQEERSAVRKFLEHLSSNELLRDEAALALDRYWAGAGVR